MPMKHIVSFLIFLCLVGWGPFNLFPDPPINEPTGSKNWLAKETKRINQQANNINPHVLRLSLVAYLKARRQGMDRKQLITIIDYSKPSTERRLWVVDLKNARVLFNTWVTHGKNSGKVNATSFSNQPGSLKSSLGVFLTTNETYVGNNGYSLRMQGLERGINDNAYRRDIVFHGAWYAAGNIAQKYGQLGRSFGCPAVNENTARPLIDTIRNNTLVVAYYPDRYWLRSSTFLRG
ncbi:MAG: hypothetical protein ACD_45C00701G0012 [uncultured bacterium]|nr:MAG: hypothetical protein ACD_45C00701G0012 [uncultured bacterium]